MRLMTLLKTTFPGVVLASRQFGHKFPQLVQSDVIAVANNSILKSKLQGNQPFQMALKADPVAFTPLKFQKISPALVSSYSKLTHFLQPKSGVYRHGASVASLGLLPRYTPGHSPSPAMLGESIAMTLFGPFSRASTSALNGLPTSELVGRVLASKVLDTLVVQSTPQSHDADAGDIDPKYEVLTIDCGNQGLYTINLTEFLRNKDNALALAALHRSILLSPSFTLSWHQQPTLAANALVASGQQQRQYALLLASIEQAMLDRQALVQAPVVNEPKTADFFALRSAWVKSLLTSLQRLSSHQVKQMARQVSHGRAPSIARHHSIGLSDHVQAVMSDLVSHRVNAMHIHQYNKRTKQEVTTTIDLNQLLSAEGINVPLLQHIYREIGVQQADTSVQIEFAAGHGDHHVNDDVSSSNRSRAIQELQLVEHVLTQAASNAPEGEYLLSVLPDTDPNQASDKAFHHLILDALFSRSSSKTKAKAKPASLAVDEREDVLEDVEPDFSLDDIKALEALRVEYVSLVALVFGLEVTSHQKDKDNLVRALSHAGVIFWSKPSAANYPAFKRQCNVAIDAFESACEKNHYSAWMTTLRAIFRTILDHLVSLGKFLRVLNQQYTPTWFQPESKETMASWQNSSIKSRLLGTIPQLDAEQSSLMDKLEQRIRPNPHT